jgi:lysophospholipase L1-like esterase
MGFWMGGFQNRPVWWDEGLGIRYVSGTKEQDPCVGNFAMSGATTVDIEKYIEPRLQTAGKRIDSQTLFILLIGTNDIAHSPLAPAGKLLDDNRALCQPGHECKRNLDFSMGAIEARYDAIVQWAKNRQQSVVVGTLPPVSTALGTGWRNPLIVELNQWILHEAQTNGLEVADFYKVLVDPSTGTGKTELFRDAVHPNRAGFDLMAPVVLAAIARAKASPAPSKNGE